MKCTCPVDYCEQQKDLLNLISSHKIFQYLFSSFEVGISPFSKLHELGLCGYTTIAGCCECQCCDEDLDFSLPFSSVHFDSNEVLYCCYRFYWLQIVRGLSTLTVCLWLCCGCGTMSRTNESSECPKQKLN